MKFKTYLSVRDDPGNRGVRMAYHDGVLEINSPALRHDALSRRLLLLVAVYCEAFSVDYTAVGSATVYRGTAGAKKGHGKEPDEGFFLQDAAAAAARLKTLDRAVCPPPPLWVEVDDWSSSRARLPLYAALGVPEVWRYKARSGRVWFGRLAGDTYEPLGASEALPGLTTADVAGLLAEFSGEPTSTWKGWVERVWFPAHRQELIDRGAGR